MNLGLEETVTLVGLLNKVGETGSRAGTASNAILRQLGPASRMLRFDIVRANDGALDLAATLENLAARLPDDTDRRAAIIQKAFGDEGAAVALLLPKLDEYRAGLEDAATAAGVAEAAWASILATTGERVDLLGLRAAVARNAIGEALQAPIGDTADRLGEVTNWIGAAAEESPNLVRRLAGVALGIGGVVGASIVAAGTRWVLLSLRQGWHDVGRAVMWTTGRIRAFGVVGRLGGAVSGLGRLIGAAGRWVSVARLAAGAGLLWKGVVAVIGAVVGSTAGLVVAGAALIGGAVYLVYKHWEPIKEFFSNLWGAVAAEFEPVVQAWSAVFTDFGWDTVGAAVVRTLVGGVVGSASLLWDGTTFLLGKVRDLLPFSDARTGPLSRLTAAGGAIIRTIGDGVQRAGPGALRRPLAAQLTAAAAGLTLAAVAPAAAGLTLAAAPSAVAPAAAGLTLAAAPSAVAPAAASPPAAAVVNNHYNYNVTVNAAPGEDARSLAGRVMEEIERQQQIRSRRARHDDL